MSLKSLNTKVTSWEPLAFDHSSWRSKSQPEPLQQRSKESWGREKHAIQIGRVASTSNHPPPLMYALHVEETSEPRLVSWAICRLTALNKKTKTEVSGPILCDGQTTTMYDPGHSDLAFSIKWLASSNSYTICTQNSQQIWNDTRQTFQHCMLFVFIYSFPHYFDAEVTDYIFSKLVASQYMWCQLSTTNSLHWTSSITFADCFILFCFSLW